MAITDPNGARNAMFERYSTLDLHHKWFPFPVALNRPGAEMRVGRHAGGAYVAFVCGERMERKDNNGHWIEVNIYSDKLIFTIKEDYRRHEWDEERYSRDIRRDWSDRSEVSFPFSQDSLDFDIIEAATRALRPEIRTEIDRLVEAGEIYPDIRDTIFSILDQTATISQPAHTLA